MVGLWQPKNPRAVPVPATSHIQLLLGKGKSCISVKLGRQCGTVLLPGEVCCTLGQLWLSLVPLGEEAEDKEGAVTLVQSCPFPKQQCPAVAAAVPPAGFVPAVPVPEPGRGNGPSQEGLPGHGGGPGWRWPGEDGAGGSGFTPVSALVPFHGSTLGLGYLSSVSF